MKKRILAFLLTAVLAFGLLPTAAFAANSPWTGTDGGASGITVDTAPSAVKWALTISPKANGLADNSDVYAVVIPTDVYNAKPGSFLTSIDVTNYAEASKLGLSAGDHRATTVMYAGGGAIPLPGMTLPSFAVQPATYHKQYTYIMFSNRGAGNVKNYYTGTFWVDTEGNTGTRDASYMVRYNGNATSVGSSQSVSGTPGNVITKPESANTELTFGGISRQGYTFLGWDTNKDLMGTVPNDAAASNTQPAYVTGSNPSFKPADTSRGMNEIQDIYAIWKPVQVTIAAQAQAMGELRVGVSFAYTPILGGANGTTKKVSVSAADSEWLAGHGLSIQNNAITGVPTVWTTEGKDITLTVADESNKTTATFVVALPKIEKGLQLQPDTTVTTGLSTTMADDGDENTNDGRLIGFYAAGQPTKTDSANTGMTDGTGTYTEYYLTKGMVYEYRPKTAENNGAWREIPAPKGLYDVNTPEWAGFEASLSVGATTRYKTTISSKTTASYATVTEGGPWTAWDAAYGAIIFDDGGLPVVTGLAKDAEYEMRFRESDAYDPSPAATITVGGSSSGGSGPAAPGDFASITFYDWDGMTVLGSVVVAKTATADEVKVQMEAFAEALSASVELRNQHQADNGTANNFYYPDGSTYPMTAKKGYSFGKWIDFDSTDYTSYGNAVTISNANQTEVIPEPANYVPTGEEIAEGLMVKAAYCSNADMDELITGAAAGRNYSVELYGSDRFAATANYSVTVKITRENSDEIGVPRTRNLGLRVLMTTNDGVQIFSLLKLDNQDEITAEIVPNTNIKSLTATVVDLGEVSNWVGGTTTRSAAYTSLQVGDSGFVVLGNVTAFNEFLAAGGSAPANAYFSGLGLDLSKVTGTGATQRNNAWAAILKAWKEKNPDYITTGRYEAMSKADMQAAVDAVYFGN